jgi:hypothetical protein
MNLEKEIWKDIKNSRICHIEYKINEILKYLEEIE